MPPALVRRRAAGYRNAWRERSRRRPVLSRQVNKLLLMVAAATAALFAADQLLFSLFTFDGLAVVPSYASDDDLGWWARRIGQVPAELDEVYKPDAISGRSGTWWHRDGGRGAAGAGGTPFETESGIAAFDLHADSPLVVGRALATNEIWAYRTGTALPLVFLERWYVGATDVNPGHPLEPAQTRWNRRLRYGALAINVFCVAMLIDLLFIWLRRAQRGARVLRKRCPHCAYILLPEQSRCPECGRTRTKR